jgi:hypothetical protein
MTLLGRCSLGAARMLTAHRAARTHLHEFLFEFLVDLRILVLVLHLRAAFFNVFIYAVEFSHSFELSAAGAQR